MRKIIVFIFKIIMRILYTPKVMFTNKAVQGTKINSPCVIIANHTHLFDPILIETTLRGKMTAVVAKDWYEKKSVHWLLKLAKCIPCDRYNLDTEWFLLAKRAIDEGKSIIIFPEGKCNTDGRISEFKSGYAFLARTYKLPVLCLGINGIFSILHRTRIIIDVPEKVERTKGIPSSKDLEIKNEYFRQKVIELKNRALKDTMENEEPTPGDVISVNRGHYRHFGIFIGDNQVIHFAAEPAKEIDPKTAVVKQTTLGEFLRGDPLEIQKPLKRKSFSPHATIRRAKSQLGEMKGRYRLAWNNCEHFAIWCKYGVKRSKQVKKIFSYVFMALCLVAMFIYWGKKVIFC